MSEQIKNNLKLLGYTIKKHMSGVYVASNSNMEGKSVYNSKFEPIVFNRQDIVIYKSFIKTTQDNIQEVYTKDGTLVAKVSSENRVHVYKELVAELDDGLLERVILKDGTSITNVPKVFRPLCVVSKKGDIYTVNPRGDLYCGATQIEENVLYGNNNFNGYYYTKIDKGVSRVYELDTNKLIAEQGLCETTLLNDKVMIISKDKQKYGLYKDNNLKSLKFDTEEVNRTDFLYSQYNDNIVVLIENNDRTYDIADLEMNRLTSKSYTYIKHEIYGNYIVGRNEEDKWEILDSECNLLMVGDSAKIGLYGIVVTNGNNSVTVDY